MEARKSYVHSEPRYFQINGQLPGGGESRRVIVETGGYEFVANLAVKLFVERFVRSAIQADHFKRHYRIASALPLNSWQGPLGLSHSVFSLRQNCSVFPIQGFNVSTINGPRASVRESGMAISRKVDR
jgi:hypothetical protein